MEVFFLCKTSSRPSGSVPSAPSTSLFAETSLEVSLPGSSSSSSSLPLGGQGKRGGSGVHLVFLWGASSPPARLWSGERGGSASGHLSVACGLAPSSPPPSGGGGAGVGSLAADALFPASPRLLPLPNSHRTFHDVGIWGSLQSLAPAFYPPASPALRSVARGWIRGLGPVRLALVDVAVALALSPLTVRGLAVVSVGDGRRPLHALLVDAHAVSGRGLLTAAALSVGALGRVVPGLDPRIDIGHAVTSLGVRGRGLLPAAAPTVSVRVFPACRGVRRVRSRSHALPNRSLDRSRSCVRLPASPARLRAVEAGRLARRGPQEGVGAFVSQPPVAWVQRRASLLFWRGVHCRSPVCFFQELAKFVMSLSGSSSLGASGVLAGVTASAAASWGIACPASAAAGAATLCAATVTPAGAGVFCLLLPLLFLACLVISSVRESPALAGVAVGRLVMGTDGRAWSAPGEGLLLLPALRVVGGRRCRSSTASSVDD